MTDKPPIAWFARCAECESWLSGEMADLFWHEDGVCCECDCCGKITKVRLEIEPRDLPDYREWLTNPRDIDCSVGWRCAIV